ncbi:MAG: hypothetical protein ACKVHE_23630 [Planctomycetales bacterium]|jgi:hypothetical protein
MNPYFEEGALFPLVLFRKLSFDEAFYSVRVDEFTSPAAFFGQIGLRSLHLDAAAVLWLLVAGSFLWLGTRRRVSVFRALLFVAFSYLGFNDDPQPEPGCHRERSRSLREPCGDFPTESEFGHFEEGQLRRRLTDSK